jgi:hypothetical protein
MSYNFSRKDLGIGETCMMTKRPVGRPRKERSAVIALRFPESQIEAIDEYLDTVEQLTGMRPSRNEAVRLAVAEWLERRDQKLSRNVSRAN